MRICLIFNPQAGTADRIKDFLLHFTGTDRCELRPTSTDADACAIARQAVDEGVDRIVVAGGDGTIHQAVNGIAPDFDRTELAVLPFGTGNDLARALGLTADQMEDACAAAFGKDLEPIDVIRVSYGDDVSYCINVANGGLGGLVAIDVQSADKHRWGPMAYWMTSVSRLVDLEEFDVEFWLDDRSLHREAYGVAVANGRFVGGGFPIAPQALLNDGLIDVTVVPVLPAFELLGAGLNFALGRDGEGTGIQCFRASRVRIHSDPEMPFSVDGESTRRIDALFEVLPRALRVVVGPDPVGLNPEPDAGLFD